MLIEYDIKGNKIDKVQIYAPGAGTGGGQI